ncbi:MAG: cyclomaltodextrinase N-terminal domain-containing protein, partial [Ignavibacteria bacterium]|nr:cyclomaltodextrinase N-terminal domain-containing protein [Ignavibacteria bacterium]
MRVIYNGKKFRVEKKTLLSLIIFIFFFFPVSFPQEFAVNKIEPPNWWAGMKLNAVQLMVYGKNLNDVSVTSAYPQLKVSAVNNAESPNYLFVDIEIPVDLPRGEYEIVFRKGDNIVKYNYLILNRQLKAEDHNGFSNEDVIYLIFADRFCDGNPDNNTIGDSLDEFTSTDFDGRHGGDIEGIIS